MHKKKEERGDTENITKIGVNQCGKGNAEEIKKGLIELFKDSPYIEYIMDYVGPSHGRLRQWCQAP